MRVLHYALGFPPYRSGGLTKYVYDIMIGQAEAGNDVSMLWPGRYASKGGKYTLYRKKGMVGSYELLNPLPVPLLSGINQIAAYTQYGSIEEYTAILHEISPQIIHMHTLMGIHAAFLEAAHRLEIPIVYTTHDYFGLCPRVNLFFRGQICSGINDARCSVCNAGALSLPRVRLMQSSVYRVVKEPMKQLHFKRVLQRVKRTQGVERLMIGEYEKLSSYYEQFFSQIDYFHFNSSLSESVFRSFLRGLDLQGEVITITHRDIRDHRCRKEFHEKRRLTFLGDEREDKGFNLLIDVLDDLYNQNYCFSLNVYGEIKQDREYLVSKRAYQYSELAELFNETDVLIVPSVWMETFGFVAVEAKSYGIPTVLTTNVGAKDCFTDGVDAMIVEPKHEDLKRGIKKVLEDMEFLKSIHSEILREPFPFLHEEHVRKIMDMYVSVMVK